MPKAPDAPSNATVQSGLAQRRRAAQADNSAEYQQKRQQLIAVAAEVFHRNGFGKTNLKDIAAAAGTDRATLYYYVTSKQDLFVQVIRESLLAVVAEGQRILDSPASPTERLRELLRGSMRSYTEHYPYLYVYAQEDLSRLDVREESQRELADLAQRGFEILRAVIAEGLADGSFASSLSAGIIAQTFTGAIARSSIWYDPEHGADAELLGDGLAALLVDGLAVRRS
jgi:AcrR family transcriptional regulator